jgi:arylsulfatase
MARDDSEEDAVMKHARAIRLALLSTFLLALIAVGASASAQESVLPKPESPFQGKIGRTVKDSTPDFPKGVEAPAGAPNILLILTDDVGFGATSTFGGPIQTPNFQRIADNGLRYNMYHTTAVLPPGLRSLQDAITIPLPAESSQSLQPATRVTIRWCQRAPVP